MSFDANKVSSSAIADLDSDFPTVESAFAFSKDMNDDFVISLTI